MPTALLTTRAMTVRRSGEALFAKLALAIKPGGLLEVSGANGSGKTTLLRVLAGLLEPDEGEVRWRGERIVDNLAGFCAELAYVGHKDAINRRLSTLDNLRFAAALAGGDTRLQTALDKLGCASLACRLAGTLSAGQLRRVSLARLWLGQARLWLLDEPLASLDEAGCAKGLEILREHLAGGGIAVVSSHKRSSWPGAVERLALARS